jgi:hypothetical protein
MITIFVSVIVLKPTWFPVPVASIFVGLNG